MNKVLTAVWLFCIVALAPLLSTAQNSNTVQVNISLSIPQLAGKQILIAYPFWGKVYISDTLALDQKGQGILAPAAGMEKGVYKIIWPPANSYAEIIVDDEKNFTVSINDTADYINRITFTGSPQNELYYSYLRFALNKRKQIVSLDNNKSLSKEIKEEKITEVELLIKNMQDSIINSNEGSLFAEMMKLVSDYGVTNKTDYYEYRKQYLANINLADLRLTRTDALYEKVITYIEQLHAEQPDSTFAACELIIEKARAQPISFQAIITSLLNKYAGGKLILSEDVYALLGNRYYVQEKPSWINEETRQKIENQVKLILPNRIGQKAPNFKLKDIAGKTHSLHKIDSISTVLFFYNADNPANEKWLKKFAETGKKYGKYHVAFVTVMLKTNNMATAVQTLKNSGAANCTNLVTTDDSELIANYNIINGFKIVVLNREHNIHYKNISIDNINVVLDQYLNIK